MFYQGILICWVLLCPMYLKLKRYLCVPAAVLVLAELHDVTSDVSELQIGVAVVPEVLQQAAPAGRHHIRHAVA